MITFYNETGIIYDTVFFLTSYFFENIIDHKISLFSKKTKNNLENFNELKQTIEISKAISAFCYCDIENEVKSFIINFAIQNLNFSNVSFEDLIILLSDEENIKYNFIAYYFPESNIEIENGRVYIDNKRILELLEESQIAEIQKKYFLTTLLSFTDTLYELKIAIKNIYNIIKKYHNKKTDLIEQIKNDFYENEIKTINRIHNNFKIPKPEKDVKYCFSISLLSLYYIELKIYENIYCFCLSYDLISDNKDIVNYDLNPSTFAKLISSNIRSEIFDMFLKYKELCAADIANKIDINKTNIHSHLNEMLANKLIEISSIEGRRYYFKLNTDYLISIARNIEKIANEVRNLNTKGELKRYDLPRKKRRPKYKQYDENDGED